MVGRSQSLFVPVTLRRNPCFVNNAAIISLPKYLFFSFFSVTNNLIRVSAKCVANRLFLKFLCQRNFACVNVPLFMERQIITKLTF